MCGPAFAADVTGGSYRPAPVLLAVTLGSCVILLGSCVMGQGSKHVKARTHVLQGAIGTVLGVALCFTPWYEWGIILSVAAFAFLVYGLVVMFTNPSDE